MSQNVERMPETIGGIDYRQHDAELGSIALGERIRALMGRPRFPYPHLTVAATDTLSPFERQERALARGAQLTEVRPIRRADPTMTLGGVSSGWPA